ncbi:MAG: deoxyribonuclease V [Abitibacteriaceae bacterium]|nr:deoxyribonuclease V [Abditibacteriaceae bacterium]MBV9864837.1 deoxyribonuclease V [Abditibacteriaceae bacterium]
MAHYKSLHDWNLNPQEAVTLQSRLRQQVQVTPLTRPIETIAGTDISFNKFSTTIYAGIVVLRLPTLEIIEQVGIVTETHFPYIPGLLSFRETPAVLEAWAKLQTEPDAVMFDGQGIAHPRRMGIASHVGLMLERPTLGCAKSVLVGKYEEPAPQRGSWSPMVHKGETIGAALRTKDKVQPIYVSPGHLIDLEAAIQLTLQCNGGYRQPEPTRHAHLLVNSLRRGEINPT